MPILGAKTAEDEAVSFARERGFIAVDTEGAVEFPRCPVTGEETCRTFPVRSSRGKRFDHPVSERGALRLQLEHIQWLFVRPLVFVVPVLYLFLLGMLHARWQTVFLPWWCHVAAAMAATLSVRWVLGRVFARTVEVVDSRFPKSIVLLRYKDHNYAVELYAHNRKQNEHMLPTS